MYKENQNKLINIVDDGDVIHVFITAPENKKDQVADALKSSFKELSKIYGGSTSDMEYDDEQFYFTLDSFEEYDDFKHIFYKKTLTNFMKYACEEARKLAKNGASCACVDDETVYGWAIHYFQEESIEGTLYTLDGEEYKPAVNKTKNVSQRIPAPAISKTSKPVAKQFNLFELVNETPVPVQKEAKFNKETVDMETGEILTPSPEEDDELSEEEMRAFDGDIDERIPENEASMYEMNDENDDFELDDGKQFDKEALAVLWELFGDELDVR